MLSASSEAPVGVIYLHQSRDDAFHLVSEFSFQIENIYCLAPRPVAPYHPSTKPTFPASSCAAVGGSQPAAQEQGHQSGPRMRKLRDEGGEEPQERRATSKHLFGLKDDVWV